MIKTSYQKELAISGTQKRGGSNSKKDVLKIQSWLTLFDIANPGNGTATSIDGGFGPATEKAVKNFQKAKNLTQTGIVDSALFSVMCQPLKKAFETQLTGNGLRELVVNASEIHLSNVPYELVINNQSNSGPWVRSYMGGNEGTPWFWCMGFVQAVVDQAASSQGKDFRDLMPVTYSCDTVGSTGVSDENLFRYNKIRNNPSLVKPGDIFLLQKSTFDWFHTGIITKVGNGIFETIEGNTNEGGSNNGNRVCKRIRNFMQSRIDVFSIEWLV